MPNLRKSIEDHVEPFATPVSLRAIGKLVGLGTSPISTRDIVSFLEPPLIFASGPLHALTVGARTYLALHRSGMFVFDGHAHENGVVGNNYAVSFAIDVRDDQGRALALEPHQKKLSGTVDPFGDRDDDFQVVGFDQRIRDRWPEIVAAHKEFSLHAATDPLQVVELVTESLAVALAVVGLTYLLIKTIPLIPIPKVTCSLTDEGIGLICNLVWTF